jgi:hypothetical protein
VAINGGQDPIGTQWARSTCATAVELDFFGFTEMTGYEPPSIVGEDVCLWLTGSNLKYDVVFSSWQSGGGGGFAYRRTAATPDECAHADAICNEDDTCGCPEGFQVVGTPGVCGLPNPCDPDPCGAGALCRRTSVDTHVCECDTVEFTKPVGPAATCDQISANVCITRGTSRGLFNSDDEVEYNTDSGSCDSPSPTLTEWALLPCADAANEDFGPWISDSFADCSPPDVLGEVGCVRLTDGSAQSWDIRMTGWCNGESSANGCFSYIRSHNVPDGASCSP